MRRRGRASWSRAHRPDWRVLMTVLKATMAGFLILFGCAQSEQAVSIGQRSLQSTDQGCGNGVCNNDEDCATCPEGCGRCVGVECTTDVECTSQGGSERGPGEIVPGHCVDGVCCESTCEGACNACNTAAAPGTCTILDGSTV